MNDLVDIESLVKFDIPPLPNVAMRVAELTQDLNASTRKIADCIGSDPILSAAVLRAANSPLYYLQRDVSTLTMAVNTLGNESIHLLVLASAAIGAFRRKGYSSSLETTLWEHSVAVGLGAREIMLVLGLRGTEQAFTCGLLHDIGKLLLLRHNEAAYRQIIKDAAELGYLGNERNTFGYTHAQVGALAARRWNLPDAITHAIYHHHQPSQAEDSMLIARVVDVADALANRAGLGFWEPCDKDLGESESVMALQLSEADLAPIWERTQSHVSETFAAFK